MQNSKRPKGIIKHIEENVCKRLRDEGIRNVLVGVSGGADSVALLCACARLAPRLGMHMEAANCNFHLRGAESDRDSEFTVQLCERLGVTLHRLDYNVEAYIAEHPGASTEMACRELRYADFFRIMEERGLNRVAVAHNADDDIETMLLNLLRGSGTRGLKGMDVDNGRVIRPLLEITRKEIESYLSEIRQDFITDSSNLTSGYRRNFLRREVLPLIGSRWPGARRSLSRTLSIMKEESTIVEVHYRKELERLCVDSSTLLVYSNGVTEGTVLRFIEPFGGNPAVAEEIMRSLEREFRERRWKLSERYEAVLERDRLIIADMQRQPSEPAISWERLDMTPTLMAEIKKNHSHDIVYLPEGESTYDLRRPQSGDRMSPLGMKGTRLVSDIISDARLDSQSKDAVRVLVRKSDGKIIWTTGLKRSRHDLISPNSEYVYRATLVSN